MTEAAVTQRSGIARRNQPVFRHLLGLFWPQLLLCAALSVLGGLLSVRMLVI